MSPAVSRVFPATLLARVKKLVALTTMLPLARLLKRRNGVAASIIIVTRNQATYLEMTLASLERQLFPSVYWELVIVDDASEDNTVEVVNDCVSRGKIRLKFLQSETQLGFSNARNKALEHARGTIIVFLREDEIATSKMLVQHLRHHASGSVIVLGNTSLSVHSHIFSPPDVQLHGVTLQRFLCPEDLDSHEIWQAFVGAREIDDKAIWSYLAAQEKEVSHPWVYFSGGNASIPREVLIEVGGFDEGQINWNLGDWGLECRELALRMKQAGVRFHCENNAITLQQSHPMCSFDERARARNLNYFFFIHNEFDHVVTKNI